MTDSTGIREPVWHGSPELIKDGVPTANHIILYYPALRDVLTSADFLSQASDQMGTVGSRLAYTDTPYYLNRSDMVKSDVGGMQTSYAPPVRRRV